MNDNLTSQIQAPKKIKRNTFLANWIGVHLFYVLAKRYFFSFFYIWGQSDIGGALLTALTTTFSILFLIIIQRQMLKPYLRHAKLWLTYSLWVMPLIVLIEWGYNSLLYQNLELNNDTFMALSSFFAEGLSLLLLGTMQVLVLRKEFEGTWQWPLVLIGSHLLEVSLISGFTWLMINTGFNWPYVLLPDTTFYIILTMSASATITGLGLARIIRNPISEEKLNIARHKQERERY